MKSWRLSKGFGEGEIGWNYWYLVFGRRGNQRLH